MVLLVVELGFEGGDLLEKFLFFQGVGGQDGGQFVVDLLHEDRHVVFALEVEMVVVGLRLAHPRQRAFDRKWVHCFVKIILNLI